MTTITTEQLLELGRKIQIPVYSGDFHTSLDGMLVNGYIDEMFDPFYDRIPNEIKLMIFEFFNVHITQYIVKDTKHVQQKDETNFIRNKKILFLGTQFCGKSTIFKAIKMIDNVNENKYEMDEHCTIIRQNCVSGILTLLKIFLSSKTLLKDIKINIDLIASIELIMKYAQKRYHPSYNFTQKTVDYTELGHSIKNVITNIPKLIQIYEESNILYPDNMKYFFDYIERIMCNLDYIPSMEDILKVSEQTIGVHQFHHFVGNHSDISFHIIDIGGSWMDRFKWIDHFNGNDAVCYIAALSDFNKYSLHDINKNAMHESIQLFDELINSKWLKKTEFILLLNKDDLFRELLRRRISISNCFSSINGWYGEQWNEVIDQDYEQRYDEAIEFIRRQYKQCNHTRYRRIFVHVMNGTDKNCVERVFWDIKNIPVGTSLRISGLV